MITYEQARDLVEKESERYVYYACDNGDNWAFTTTDHTPGRKIRNTAVDRVMKETGEISAYRTPAEEAFALLDGERIEGPND